MKYIKKFNQHSLYEAYIVGASFKNLKKNNVSFCKSEKHVHYNHYVQPVPHFLDILYSDLNGNLSFTSEVLPVSDGKTPIALCIAGQGFFGTNEKARWMSLKYMNCTTPETGSLNASNIYHGINNTDMLTIDNIWNIYNGGSTTGYLSVDYSDNSSQSNIIPNIFDENNNWNLSELGVVNMYVLTDIDGKNKTSKILEYETEQTTWMTDVSIENHTATNHSPAACCCARYHTLGTQTGNWYFGAGGEMGMVIAQKTDINTKLASIKSLYTNECINQLANGNYWTCTENNSYNSYYIRSNNGYISPLSKGNTNYLIAMLQY